MAGKKQTGSTKPGNQRKSKAGTAAGGRAKSARRGADDSSRWTDELREEKRARILEELRSIPMYWMAAAAAEVHPNTLAGWRRDDEQFDLACRKARADACRPHVKRLASTDSAASAAAARYLEKVAPGEFKHDFRDDELERSTRPVQVTLVARRAEG